MNNDDKQKYEEMQKSAKEFANSGVEMAKHAKAAIKTGAGLYAQKIKDAAGENGAIQQVRERVSAGVNAAAEKVESVAANSNSEILHKATASRKKVLILFGAVAAVIVIVILAVMIGGGGRVKINSPEEAQKYVLKILTKNLDYLSGIELNKTPGYELFALGAIIPEESRLTVTTKLYGKIDGFYLGFVEPSSVNDLILTDDGNIFGSLPGSGKNARTRIYWKIYDTKKGWMPEGKGK